MLFLSHSSKDKIFVRFLANELIICGHEIWLDERQLLPGDFLPSSLSKAINTSNKMLIFVSKESLTSSWVQYEIETASLNEKKNKPLPIIPCVLGNIENNDLPLYVRNTVFVEFRDARHYEKNFKRLLAATATGHSQLHLPPFDCDLSDHYISQNLDVSIKSWIVDFLKSVVCERLDQTERFWIYITLAKIGEQDVVFFLKERFEQETGFAKRGVEQALAMFKKT